ncbi:MAG: low-complexity tail membrane protein [Cyanobacteriota bacterium]
MDIPSFRAEPFLWIHLAGGAVYPLACLLTWLALGVGAPFPYYGLEVGFLLLAGLAPILWMQWFRPFEIFSLLIISLSPEALTPRQRQILSLFRCSRQRWLTLGGGLLGIAKLAGLYYFAPLASVAVADLPQNRFLALGLAALAFLISNLFLQVPLSVLGVLLSSEEALNQQPAPEPGEIPKLFTLPGLRLRRIPLLSSF